jgi:antitoxin ParD1/3/4
METPEQKHEPRAEGIADSALRARKARAQARLEALLLEGLDSGEPVEVTPEFWEECRRELKRRLDERGKERRTS